MKTEKPLKFVKSTFTVASAFCENCGQDLYVCDFCSKRFNKDEKIYCADEENTHICVKCWRDNKKQQQKTKTGD